MEAQDRFNIVGTIVDGRYRVEEVVGEGGFGVVYRAHHVRLDGPVALKVLKVPGDLARREAMIAAFENEGRLLFSLASLHSDIVRVLESGTLLSPTGSVTPYLVLEWLDGVTLDVELQYRRAHGLRPMNLADTVALLAGPAEALAAAHSKRIAHRDLKPANLFLVSQAGQLTPKLLDFGTAKVIEASLGATTMFARTEGGRCSFTPAYGAPEQWWRELGATGPWTDVHALALVCLEVLTGRVVFRGSPGKILNACLAEEHRPSPRNLGVDVPDNVERAFVRALSLKPRDRFPDVAAFWEAVCHGMDTSALDGPRIACMSDRLVSVRRPSIHDRVIPEGTTQPASSVGEPTPAARALTPEPPGATLESPVVSRARTRGRTVSAGHIVGGSLAGMLAIGLIVAAVKLSPGGGSVPEAKPAVTRSTAEPSAKPVALVINASDSADVDAVAPPPRKPLRAKSASRVVKEYLPPPERTAVPTPVASDLPAEAGPPTIDDLPAEAGPPTINDLPAEAGPPTIDDLPADRK
jgi:eukaryotic-like serine/threonine-protein kinase